MNELPPVTETVPAKTCKTCTLARFRAIDSDRGGKFTFGYCSLAAAAPMPEQHAPNEVYGSSAQMMAKIFKAARAIADLPTLTAWRAVMGPEHDELWRECVDWSTWWIENMDAAKSRPVTETTTCAAHRQI